MISKVLLLITILHFSIIEKVLAQNNLYPEEPKLMSYLSSLTYDEEMKHILHPFYVYVDKWQRNIYVIDSKGGRVTVYDQNLLPLYTLDKRWGITAPTCVVTDKKGNLYILQNKGGGITEILKFNRALLLERVYPISEDFMVLNIAVDDEERLYVALRYKNNGNGLNEARVVVWDREGREVKDITPKEGGRTVSIDSIKIDTKGRIFMISLFDSKIYVLDKNYQLLFKFGEKGGVTGKLSNPKSLGVDEKRDIVYIVDYMRHVVNVYSLKNGVKYVFEFGGYGIGVEGWFAFPSSVDVDWEGKVYVADTFNSRIQILTPYEGSTEITPPRNRVVKLPSNTKESFSMSSMPVFQENFSF